MKTAFEIKRPIYEHESCSACDGRGVVVDPNNRREYLNCDACEGFGTMHTKATVELTVRVEVKVDHTSADQNMSDEDRREQAKAHLRDAVNEYGAGEVKLAFVEEEDGTHGKA